MRDITIFAQARKSSRRCENKLLRPFGQSTLIDIFLEKLNTLDGCRVCFGAADEEFIRKVGRFPNIEIIHRSKESVDSHSDSKKIFQILRDEIYFANISTHLHPQSSRL